MISVRKEGVTKSASPFNTDNISVVSLDTETLPGGIGAVVLGLGSDFGLSL